MVAERRDTRFNMLMTATERAMLQALAEQAGLKESDIVRQHIRQHYAKLFGDTPPRKRRKR